LKWNFSYPILDGREIDAAVTATATGQFANLSELTTLKTFIASFAITSRLRTAQ
jgi:hypothetical protein